MMSWCCLPFDVPVFKFQSSIQLVIVEKLSFGYYLIDLTLIIRKATLRQQTVPLLMLVYMSPLSHVLNEVG